MKSGIKDEKYPCSIIDEDMEKGCSLYTRFIIDVTRYKEEKNE